MQERDSHGKNDKGQSNLESDLKQKLEMSNPDLEEVFLNIDADLKTKYIEYW